jgi:hypothetical protein
VLSELGAEVLTPEEREEHSKNHTRLEFAFPSTDTRNDMAALFLLTGLYEALSREAIAEKVLTFPAKYKDAADIFAAQGQLFSKLEAIVQSEKNEAAEGILKQVKKLKSDVTLAVREGKLTQPVLAAGMAV